MLIISPFCHESVQQPLSQECQKKKMPGTII